jgi:hypothetical protein
MANDKFMVMKRAKSNSVFMNFHVILYENKYRPNAIMSGYIIIGIHVFKLQDNIYSRRTNYWTLKEYC